MTAKVEDIRAAGQAEDEQARVLQLIVGVTFPTFSAFLTRLTAAGFVYHEYGVEQGKPTTGQHYINLRELKHGKDAGLLIVTVEGEEATESKVK